MTTPATQVLSTLTRRNAVKVAFAASIEDICLAIGEVVGHGSILSASRMNNATVIFLSNVEKVNQAVESGIVIGGDFVQVLPLTLPSKRVTLSNVPPFLSDQIITEALSRYGKLVSPIKKIPISTGSPLLKHIVSFRRFAYMIIKDDEELDLSLSFRVDDFDYIIFVTTARTKCFGCGKAGHLIRNCPEKKATEKEDTVSNPSTSGETGGPVVSLSSELQSNIHSETEVDICREVAGTKSVVGTGIDTEKKDQTDIVSAVKQSKHPEKESVTQVEQKKSGFDCVDMEMEAQIEMFKAPLKRKKNDDKFQNKKTGKKADLDGSNDDEIESESDSSDSSVALSLSDFSVRSYDSEEIKLFLKSTKNKRGVCVQDYFPNITQFVEKTRNFMAEGCFTNKEVYRLKKLVRNVEKLKDDV